MHYDNGQERISYSGDPAAYNITIYNPINTNLETPITTEDLIAKECDGLKEMLISKNRKYGDSCARPGYPFKLSPTLAIKARLNDKIARLAQQNSDEDEDITLDILGYLILFRISIRNEEKNSGNAKSNSQL